MHTFVKHSGRYLHFCKFFFKKNKMMSMSIIRPYNDFYSKLKRFFSFSVNKNKCAHMLNSRLPVSRRFGAHGLVLGGCGGGASTLTSSMANGLLFRHADIFLFIRYICLSILSIDE